MSYCIVFANQKGGVGKTTSVANIAAYLAEYNKKVLVIDFDPQGNLSSSFGIKHHDCTFDIYDVIMNNCTCEQAIQHIDRAHIDIIPTSINLAGASVELVNQENRNFFLHNALKPIHEKYDYILIDPPPSLGMLTLNALSAANSVIIPLQTEYFALEGLSQLTSTIELIQSNINQALKLDGIFFTMYDGRTNLAQEIVNNVITFYQQQDIVFQTIIPRNIRLSEAPSHEQAINTYAPSCIGAKSYAQLSQEIIARSTHT